MDHRMLQDQLVMLQDLELPPAERQALLAHVAGCHTCATRVREWQGLQGALAGAPQPEPSETFVVAVMDRLPRKALPQPSPVHRALPGWLMPRLGLGLAGMLAALTLLKPEPVIATETLLLAGAPAGANWWGFASEPPDAGLLLDIPTEAP